MLRNLWGLDTRRLVLGVSASRHLQRAVGIGYGCLVVSFRMEVWVFSIALRRLGVRRLGNPGGSEILGC